MDTSNEGVKITAIRVEGIKYNAIFSLVKIQILFYYINNCLQSAVVLSAHYAVMIRHKNRTENV